MILRVMSDQGFTAGKPIVGKELMQLTSIRDEMDFMNALLHLRELGFVTGTLGGIEVNRNWITARGIEHVRHETSSRLRISLDAENILRYLVEVEPPQGYQDVEGVSPEKLEN